MDLEGALTANTISAAEAAAAQSNNGARIVVEVTEWVSFRERGDRGRCWTCRAHSGARPARSQERRESGENQHPRTPRKTLLQPRRGAGGPPERRAAPAARARREAGREYVLKGRTD